MIKLAYIIIIIIQIQTIIEESYLNGRWLQQNGQYLADWPGVSLNFQLTNGTYLSLILGNCSFVQNIGLMNIQFRINVWINKRVQQSITVQHKEIGQVVNIDKNLNPSEIYEFSIVKITEAQFGEGLDATIGPWILQDIQTDGLVTSSNKTTTQKMLFIGDSQTAGYGNDGAGDCYFSLKTENNDHGHPRFVAQNQNAEYHVIAWSGKGIYRNAFDFNRKNLTMFDLYQQTLAQSNQFIWDHQKFIPDIISINLGQNDFTGIPLPDGSEFKRIYVYFIVNILHVNFPKAQILVGCGPMALFVQETCYFVEEVAREASTLIGNNQVKYVSFLELLTPYDIGCAGHPNAFGQFKMASIINDQIDTWKNNFSFIIRCLYIFIILML